MFNQPADDYDKQYYEKGLAYDKDYAKARQVVKDKVQPKIKLKAAVVTIQFNTKVNGSLLFARPSDRHMDRKFSLNADNNHSVYIPFSQLTKGQWQLVFEWTAGGKQYLYKTEIYLP